MLYGIPNLHENLVRLPASPFSIHSSLAQEILNRFSPMPQLVRDNLAFFVLTPPCYDVAGDVLFISDTGFLAALTDKTTILSLARFPFFFGRPLLLNPRKFLMSWYLCINASSSIWGSFFSGAIVAQQSRLEEEQEDRDVATAKPVYLLLKKSICRNSTRFYLVWYSWALVFTLKISRQK